MWSEAARQRSLHGGVLQRGMLGGGGKRAGGTQSCSTKPEGVGGWGSESWWQEHAIHVIIGANIGVFVMWQSLKLRRFMAKNFALSTTGVLVDWKFHTVLTSVFSHYDWVHLGTNIVTLLLFGTETLAVLGARRFVALYMVGGLFSSCCQVAWPIISGSARYSPNQLGLGASGAINAVVAFSVLTFPGRMLLFYWVLPVSAAGLGVLFLGKDIAGLMLGDPSLGNPAHVGGALFGGALWMRWGRPRPFI
ncbi:hypothetical protein T484DRAFT_1967501 [Baffinella frigidus]|nr:hypothetical protein T484DRAFT_1967501 [Cryptophyta sp. CCMP2293]